MINLLEHPLAMSVFCGLAMSASALIGIILNRWQASDADARNYRGIFIGSTLGLLSLVIGFTLSMSVARYDARKSYEAQEANAIGTEYAQVDLLVGAERAELRALMSNYLDERIRFYVSRNEQDLRQVAVRTARLQTAMWSAVRASIAAQPIAIVSLVVAGMNQVLEDQGYAEAAWRNRLPIETWVLMLAIAVLANALLGFGAPRTMSRIGVLTIMPTIISVAFLLIADIDSPRGGFIHAEPHNLLDLAQSLKSLPGDAADPTAAKVWQTPHG